MYHRKICSVIDIVWNKGDELYGDSTNDSQPFTGNGESASDDVHRDKDIGRRTAGESRK